MQTLHGSRTQYQIYSKPMILSVINRIKIIKNKKHCKRGIKNKHLLEECCWYFTRLPLAGVEINLFPRKPSGDWTCSIICVFYRQKQKQNSPPKRSLLVNLFLLIGFRIKGSEWNSGHFPKSLLNTDVTKICPPRNKGHQTISPPSSIYFMFSPLSHLFITVLHSLTLVCGAHKQELNTLKLELNGYGRRPIAALIKLIIPIVYPFQENIIGYFSGPAKVRAPKKRQCTTPKAMPRGQKKCRGLLGGVRNSYSSESNKWMSQKWLNAQLFDKIWEGASLVYIAWPHGTKLKNVKLYLQANILYIFFGRLMAPVRFHEPFNRQN